MKNLGEGERWRNQGLHKFFEYPLLLSQEWVKVRTSNLADTFTKFIRTKNPRKICEKRERGRIQGLSKFLSTPIISGTGKATTLNLEGTFTGSIRTKAHEKFWRKGSTGVSRDCPNLSSTP